MTLHGSIALYGVFAIVLTTTGLYNGKMLWWESPSIEGMDHMGMTADFAALTSASPMLYTEIKFSKCPNETDNMQSTCEAMRAIITTSHAVAVVILIVVLWQPKTDLALWSTRIRLSLTIVMVGLLITLLSLHAAMDTGGVFEVSNFALVFIVPAILAYSVGAALAFRPKAPKGFSPIQ